MTAAANNNPERYINSGVDQEVSTSRYYVTPCVSLSLRLFRAHTVKESCDSRGAWLSFVFFFSSAAVGHVLSWYMCIYIYGQVICMIGADRDYT